MAPARSVRSLAPIVWFYLATPVFFLADWLWGINIRIVALDDMPWLKYLYYALCLGCGVLTAARPRLTHVVGLTESAVNVVLVVLTIPLAVARALNEMAAAAPVIHNPFTNLFFVNLALSTLVCLTVLFWHEYHYERQSVSPSEERRLRGET